MQCQTTQHYDGNVLTTREDSTTAPYTTRVLRLPIFLIYGTIGWTLPTENVPVNIWFVAIYIMTTAIIISPLIGGVIYDGNHYSMIKNGMTTTIEPLGYYNSHMSKKFEHGARNNTKDYNTMIPGI